MAEPRTVKVAVISAASIMASQLLLEIPISLSGESGTSEDEEVIIKIDRKRKWKKPQRIQNYIEVILPQFTARQFQQHFRISVEAYEHLLQMVGPRFPLSPNGRPTVNIEKQLLAVIWLLATPDSFRYVMNDRCKLK